MQEMLLFRGVCPWLYDDLVNLFSFHFAKAIVTITKATADIAQQSLTLKKNQRFKQSVKPP